MGWRIKNRNFSTYKRALLYVFCETRRSSTRLTIRLLGNSSPKSVSLSIISFLTAGTVVNDYLYLQEIMRRIHIATDRRSEVSVYAESRAQSCFLFLQARSKNVLKTIRSKYGVRLRLYSNIVCRTTIHSCGRFTRIKYHLNENFVVQ